MSTQQKKQNSIKKMSTRYKFRRLRELLMKRSLNILKNETLIYNQIKNIMIKLFENNIDKFTEDGNLIWHQGIEQVMMELFTGNLIKYVENQEEVDKLDEFIKYALLYDEVNYTELHKYTLKWNIVLRENFDENKEYENSVLDDTSCNMLVWIFMFYDDFNYYDYFENHVKNLKN